MKQIYKYASAVCFALTIFSISSPAFAVNAWYYGVVNRITFTGGADGSFIVTVKSTGLDDCKWKYAYFKASNIGAETAKEAYAMAMTSLLTSRTMGFVIDKSINGAGGECDVTSMTADLK